MGLLTVQISSSAPDLPGSDRDDLSLLPQLGRRRRRRLPGAGEAARRAGADRARRAGRRRRAPDRRDGAGQRPARRGARRRGGRRPPRPGRTSRWRLPAGCAPGLLIGATCRTRHDVEQAAGDGADYAGFGPVFATTTRPVSRTARAARGGACGRRRCRWSRSAGSMPACRRGRRGRRPRRRRHRRDLATSRSHDRSEGAPRGARVTACESRSWEPASSVCPSPTSCCAAGTR